MPSERDLAKGWSWRSLDQVDIPAREKLLLKDILSKRIATFNLGSDTLVSDGSKSGEYTSKDGYNLLLSQQLSSSTSVPSALCWDKMCLPKAGLFSWLALQNQMLTTDRFRKMGYEGPSRCPLCEEAEEDKDHILINYNYVSNCWLWLCKKLGWYSSFPNSILGMFQGWPILFKNSLYGGLWNLAPSLVIWEL